MEDLTERFIKGYKYLSSVGLIENDSDFAKKLQVSRSMVTEILKGRSNPGPKALQNIVKEFKIDAEWLLIGEGEMIKNDADTPVDSLRLDDQYDGYITSTREPSKVFIAKLPQKHAPPIAPPILKNRSDRAVLTPQFITVDNQGEENILHISARAAAGYLDGYADPEYLQRQPSFRLPGLTNSTYRSFQVDGDSMHPTLKNGEMVIGQWVEKLEYIREDRVHILVTKNDGVIIKRLLNRINQYNKIIAKSDATNDRDLYKNIEIAPDDILEIWYATFHGGFDFQSPSDMWKRVNNHEADITILRNEVELLVATIKQHGLLK